MPSTATTTKRKTTARKRAPKSSTTTSGIKGVAPGASVLLDSHNFNGLSIPQWNPNDVIPKDLFKDSSSLPVTEKALADVAIGSIEGKRNTLRVASANIGLIGDIIRTGTEHRKLQGLSTDYAIAGVDNQIKGVKLDTAQVRLQTSEQGLFAEQQRLSQAQIKTNALTEITATTEDEWEQRKALAQSRVNSLRVAVQTAEATYQKSLRNLLGSDDAED